VSIDDLIDSIIAKVDPDVLLEILDLEMPVLVEALRDHIIDNADKFEEYLYE